MIPLNEMDASQLMSREVMEEVYSIEDGCYRSNLIAEMCLVAKRLKCRAEFEIVVNAYEKKLRETEKKKAAQEKKPINKTIPKDIVEGFTNFVDPPCGNMKCPGWLATEDGVYYLNAYGNVSDVACYHPILPAERMKNIETGEEKIKIIFRRSGLWQELIVPKTVIASSSKIVGLSATGLSVTSETAKPLVRFLADVENKNEEFIPLIMSSSKLGWINRKKGFLPYSDGVEFDGDSRFYALYKSISPTGRKEEWYEHVRELREKGVYEINFAIASSLASVLIGMLGGLGFIVDFWGESGGGKTITLMLAASIWGDPGENKYIGDFDTSDAALEARADMLNNLPIILDDTSKVSDKIKNKFESIVYSLCSGKGRSRSNKDLGLNRENRWLLSVLTNGEKPLQSYVSQGGAINRILEVECSSKIYDNVPKTLDVLRRHYGHAGKDFVNAVLEIGEEEINKIHDYYKLILQEDNITEKQTLSAAIILTADKIATDYLFKDSKYIPIEYVKKVLNEKSTVSDNERCYQFLLDKIGMNKHRFESDDDNSSSNFEKWGFLEPGKVVFFNQAFDDLCKAGGFARKSFLSWAGKQGLIEKDSEGKNTKMKRVDGIPRRCVFLKMRDTDSSGNKNNLLGNSEFVDIDAYQQKLPFD